MVVVGWPCGKEPPWQGWLACGKRLLSLSVSLLARPRGSLRQWLLGASVIAVLAGYRVLLLAYAWLADLDRREAHREMASRLLALVQQQGALPAKLSLSGVEAWIVEGSGGTRPLLRALDAALSCCPSRPWCSAGSGASRWLAPGTTGGKAISRAPRPWAPSRRQGFSMSCRM